VIDAQNPNNRQAVQQIFERAPFIKEIGYRLVDLGEGWCETALDVQPKHMQQDNFIHAGVQATMADHTAGAASATVIKDGEIVLTVEFKINLLRPAVGEALRCKATVLRAGKTLIVAESEVYAQKGADEKLCAKATVTLAVVARSDT